MDTAVAERFAQGHPDAVRDVYNAYGRLVFVVANRILGNRSLAEEATQQTFLQAWRAAGSFDAQRELGPWLATIARRVAIDVHRRESRRPSTGLDAAMAGESAAATDAALITMPPSIEQTEAIWQVRAAIDELPPDEREVVRLQHLAQLTHAEIAALLDTPIGTVKSRSFRAHKLLALRLGHLRDGADVDGPDG